MLWMTVFWVLPLVLGRGLQTLHGAVKGDLALIVFVHTLLVLEPLFGTDAGGFGAVAVDVLRTLRAVHKEQRKGRGDLGDAVAHQHIPTLDDARKKYADKMAEEAKGGAV